MYIVVMLAILYMLQEAITRNRQERIVQPIKPVQKHNQQQGQQQLMNCSIYRRNIVIGVNIDLKW